MEDLKRVLKAIDCIVFKYQGSGQFTPIFTDIPWCHKLLPNIPEHDSCHLLGNSLFLDDFIRDAKSFWQNNEIPTLDSGIWTESQEQGNKLNFEAQAINSEEHQYLIIKNLTEQFEDKQKMLQTAREMILANENTVANHHYAQERITSLVAEPSNVQLIFDSISKVVDVINTGILITDSDMSCIMENPAAYKLFNLQSDAEQGSSLSIILQLLDKQYPEFNHILCADQPWQGEICWMQPPFSMKWLMLSIVPVKDQRGKLTQLIFIASDISRIKHLQQQNEKLTLIDNLTELPNRQYFWNALESYIARSLPCYVLYVDIENFKLINDEMGHDTGDDVLLFISEQIRKIIKRDDIVARISGDEFGVILQGTSTNEQCQKVIERIAALPLSNSFKHKINHVGLSFKIGAASFPNDGNSVERLIKCINIAAKYAKNNKELSFSFYTKEMEREAQRVLKLKRELAYALEHNQFELYFQPIFITTDEHIAKAEVLIRWNHPELGLIMPGSFIPLAEETGLIIPLGKWIIEQACQALGELNYQGFNLDIAINLSPRQFNDKTLAPFIEDTIKSFKIQANNIELEVTEGLLIYNFDSVLKQLNTLRKVGIKLSVDDFGTGYSSLSYLKRLPIDTLKIDRSFIIDLARDLSDKAIVSAVIAMAHKLKLMVVAEGVEQQSQLQFLTENNCDFIQGFLLSKPLAFEKLCDKLESYKKPSSLPNNE